MAKESGAAVRPNELSVGMKSLSFMLRIGAHDIETLNI